MMGGDERKEEDEVETEVDRDHKEERIGLAKNLSLDQSEDGNHDPSPPAKPQLVEERREEDGLDCVREEEWEEAPQDAEDCTHEEELIPDAESVRTDEEAEDRARTRCHRPVPIGAGSAEEEWEKDIADAYGEKDVENLAMVPSASVVKAKTHQVVSVHETGEEIGERNSKGKGCPHDENMTYTDVGCDGCHSEDPDCDNEEQHLLRERVSTSEEAYCSHAEQQPTEWVLQSDQHNAAETEKCARGVLEYSMP